MSTSLSSLESLFQDSNKPKKISQDQINEEFSQLRTVTALCLSFFTGMHIKQMLIFQEIIIYSIEKEYIFFQGVTKQEMKKYILVQHSLLLTQFTWVLFLLLFCFDFVYFESYCI